MSEPKTSTVEMEAVERVSRLFSAARMIEQLSIVGVMAVTMTVIAFLWWEDRVHYRDLAWNLHSQTVQCYQFSASNRQGSSHQDWVLIE